MSTSPDGASAALLALYEGDVARARRMIAERGDGPTVFEAVALGEVAWVGNLLDFRKALVTDRAADGASLLHIAARFGQFVVVKALLERGADADARWVRGETPLHVAIDTNPEAVAQAIAAALVRGGADPSARDEDGASALQRGRRRGFPSVEKLLLAAGAV